MLNVLWTGTDGQPVTIFLIDCDGIRSLGQAPVMRQLDTPDWNDPNQPPSGPDLDTDRYKLALAGGTRRSPARPYIRPETTRLPCRRTCRTGWPTGYETLWKQAARPYGQRPDANQWLQCVRQPGRDRPPRPGLLSASVIRMVWEG